MSRQATAAAAASGAAVFLALALDVHLDPVGSVRLAICGAALAVATIVDLAERRIPNRLTVPALLMLLAVWVASGATIGRVAAGLTLGLGLLAVSVFAPTAIGMGDAKLALVVAFGLTGKAPDALAFALMLAAAVAGARLLVGATGRSGTLPLAPFFAAGAVIALLV